MVAEVVPDFFWSSDLKTPSNPGSSSRYFNSESACSAPSFRGSLAQL